MIFLFLGTAVSLGQGASAMERARPVGVVLEMPTSLFEVGSDVSLGIRTDADAWVYVFSTDARGTTRQLFPNGHDRDNFVRSGRLVRLPGSTYRFVALPPQGPARLCAFATTQQFDWLRSFDEVGASGEAFPVRMISPDAFRMRLDQSIADAQRRTMERQDAFPGRSGVGGVTVTSVGGTGVWSAIPRGGFTTRSITVFAPTRPVFSTVDEFAWSQQGSSFQFQSSRGGVTREPQVPLPPRVAFVPVQPAWGIGTTNPLWCPPTRVIAHTDDRHHRPASVETAAPRPRERMGTLSMTSSPSGADVFIDGRSWGSTPLRVQLPSGSYDIRMQRRNHATESRSVRVQSGRTESLRVTLPRR
jgi:hypothetical protein